jgi:hypothetical protein
MAPPSHHENGPQPPPPREGKDLSGPPHGFRHGRHGPKWHKALHVLKFVIGGVLILLLVAALHHRCYSSERRQSRKARREERHRRRAYRRAAHKQAWKSWLERHFRCRFADMEYEEKYGSFSHAENSDHEDDVASQITELQTAASVVSEIVAAEEGRAGRMSMESRTTSLPDYRSELGEELPSYEDSDGSEESSMVADGFRYTPGSSEYTPGHSPDVSEAGSVRAVLGDTKD